MPIIENNVLVKVEDKDINEDGSFSTPDSVTSIGKWAFFNCRSLTTISIPDSVKSIGKHAFSCCRSLTTISIPDSVTSIGNHAFSMCTSLTTLIIPDSVISIGKKAFSRCQSLTTLTIPDSVTSIEDRAFYACQSLTTVTIPDSVTSLKGDPFLSCTSLTTLIINAKTDAGFEQMKKRLPEELQSKVPTKEICDFVIKTKQKKLDILLQEPAINPIFAVSKELPDEITTTLAEDNWYEINKNMADDMPYYNKAKTEIEKLSLPKNNQEFNQYEAKCSEIVKECIQRACRVKDNLLSTERDIGDEKKSAASKAGLFSNSSTKSTSETDNKELSQSPGLKK